MATKHYAWADIWNGGEVSEVERFDGSKKTVVTKRNVIQRGEEVTAKSLDKEDWERMIESGVIRPYPLPEGADDVTSPTTAFMAQYYNAQGEVDPNALMELGLSNPPPAMNPPADEAKELPVGA